MDEVILDVIKKYINIYDTKLDAKLNQIGSVGITLGVNINKHHVSVDIAHNYVDVDIELNNEVVNVYTD